MTQQTLGPASQKFEQAKDRSVYWTLSMYISKSVIKKTLGTSVSAAQHRELQQNYLDSAILSNAIEPFFNDISDREHLGHVDDFLLSTPGPLQGEFVEFSTPKEICWTTEGKTFKCKPPGLDRKRQLRQRRFWYAHKNGAYSYHLSFRFDYEHSPGDLYFISLLQKVAAPKEFTTKPLPQNKSTWFADDRDNGVAPLQEVTVKREGETAAPFWEFVSKKFEDDAFDLIKALNNAIDGQRIIEKEHVGFRQLVTHSPLIEIPELVMPLSRFMFFFQDRKFFNRLMPSVDLSSGKRPRRTQLVQSDCYLPYIRKIEEALVEGTLSNTPEIELGEEYWNWATSRPEYANLSDKDVTELKKTVPAFELGRADCLHYLFLSGFNQNIIDFMNQDYSEILDSLDPIYPTNQVQEDESVIVRYANQRALISYEESSRSLEAGNDYIGTCPYAFLIQVASIHNEFLAREYEFETFGLIDNAKILNKKHKMKQAAAAFYDFRTSVFAEYKTNRYSNIFRYDSERDVFRAIGEMRGTSRKDQFLDELVTNMESQTRDLEARLTKADERSMNILLGAVGILGFFQILFTWSDTLRQFGSNPGSPVMNVDSNAPFIHFSLGPTVSTADHLSVIALCLSLAFTVLMIGGLLFVLTKKLFR